MMNRSSSMLFGGLLGLLLAVNLACSIDESGGGVKGKTNPGAEIFVYPRAADGTPITSGGSTFATTTGASLAFEVVVRPGTAGFDLQNDDNTINQNHFKFFADHQLGSDINLPGNPAGPFKDIPAYRPGLGDLPGNEAEILAAVTAASLSRAELSLPAGFNLGVFFTPDSPDTRDAASTVVLTWNPSAFQTINDAGRTTFSTLVVDADSRAAADTHTLFVRR